MFFEQQNVTGGFYADIDRNVLHVVGNGFNESAKDLEKTDLKSDLHMEDNGYFTINFLFASLSKNWLPLWPIIFFLNIIGFLLSEINSTPIKEND
ncbi:MAG: hypothetical protein LBU81_02925 [Methanosarcinales archaeon]|nr:hypothetical protein [Methanosarcinales archaeon]